VSVNVELAARIACACGVSCDTWVSAGAVTTGHSSADVTLPSGWVRRLSPRYDGIRHYCVVEAFVCPACRSLELQAE